MFGYTVAYSFDDSDVIHRISIEIPVKSFSKAEKAALARLNKVYRKFPHVRFEIHSISFDYCA